MAFGSCGIYKNQTAGPGHGYVDLLAAWMASWHLDTWLNLIERRGLLVGKEPPSAFGYFGVVDMPLFGIGPGYAGAGFGDEGYAQVYDVFHDVLDHGRQALDFVDGAFKVQFVVHL